MKYLILLFLLTIISSRASANYDTGTFDLDTYKEMKSKITPNQQEDDSSDEEEEECEIS